jgi:hypothetical protein
MFILIEVAEMTECVCVKKQLHTKQHSGCKKSEGSFTVQISLNCGHQRQSHDVIKITMFGAPSYTLGTWQSSPKQRLRRQTVGR